MSTGSINPAVLLCFCIQCVISDCWKESAVRTITGNHCPEVLLFYQLSRIYTIPPPQPVPLVLPQPSERRTIEVSLTCRRHQVFTSGPLPGDSLTWDFSSYSPSNFPSNKRFSVLLNSSKDANYAEQSGYKLCEQQITKH